MRANDFYENLEIDRWLDRVAIGSWTKNHTGTWKRNPDGTIDVDGHVSISTRTKLMPVQFGYVNGSFNCNSTNITSLKGSPLEVQGRFNCSATHITSLKGSPKKVGKGFYCSGTNIIDPYEYRYALLSVISEKFISNIKEIDEIINTYGWDGSNDPKSKRKVPVGLQKLKDLSK